MSKSNIKLVCWDWDRTFTQQNTHNACVKQKLKAPISRGPCIIPAVYIPNKEITEFADSLYAEKDKAFTLPCEEILKGIGRLLKAGIRVAITSFNSYPEAIISGLKAIGFSAEQIGQIAIICGSPENILFRKNPYIKVAQWLFQVQDNDEVLFIDDDGDNCERAREQGIHAIDVDVFNTDNLMEEVTDFCGLGMDQNTTKLVCIDWGLLTTDLGPYILSYNVLNNGIAEIHYVPRDEAFTLPRAEILGKIGRLLNAEINVAFTSFKSPPGAIISGLKAIGFSVEQMEQIKVICGYPVNRLSRKNEHTKIAQELCNVMGNDEVLVVDNVDNCDAAQKQGICIIEVDEFNIEDFMEEVTDHCGVDMKGGIEYSVSDTEEDIALSGEDADMLEP